MRGSLCLFLAATLSIGSSTAMAGSPTGPAARAIKDWFTADRSLGCVNTDGITVYCEITLDTRFRVFYSKSKSEAVVFVAYLPDQTGNASSQAVSIFRKMPDGQWDHVHPMKNIGADGPFKFRFEGTKASFQMRVHRSEDARCCPTGTKFYRYDIRSNDPYGITVKFDQRR